MSCWSTARRTSCSPGWPRRRCPAGTRSSTCACSGSGAIAERPGSTADGTESPGGSGARCERHPLGPRRSGSGARRHIRSRGNHADPMSSTGSIGGDGPRLTSVDDSEAPPRRAFTRAVRRIVPESGAIRSIALITFVDAVGLGLYSTGAIVFFVRSLHLPVGYVGVSWSIAAGVGLLASVPAGRLVDRRDAKQVLVALSFAQAVLFALFPLVEGRVAFFVVVSAAALAASAAQPARRVLIVRLFDERRRVAATAYSRSVLNVGVSVGALLAAGALALDTRPAYDALLLGNAASFVGVGLLVARLRLPPRPWAAGTAEAGPA